MDIETLRLFCAPVSNLREYLHTPFNIGDHAFASNGHLLVRVPKRKDVRGASKDFPYASILEIMHRINDDREYVELPESKHNYAKVKRPTAPLSKGYIVTVGCQGFDDYYIWLLNKLPNCRISPASDPNDMAFIKFDGGDGVIMPLRA